MVSDEITSPNVITVVISSRLDTHSSLDAWVSLWRRYKTNRAGEDNGCG